MKKTLLIMAAGIGSRYGGLKQLDKVGPSGETIIDYSLFDAIKAGYGKIVFIVREETLSAFRKLFERKLLKFAEVRFVCQKISDVPELSSSKLDRIKPWGTAHAVLQSAEVIDEPFTVVNADDFYGANSFNIASSFIESYIEENVHLLVGFELSKTMSKYGSVSRGICEIDGNNFLLSIKEKKNIRYDNGKIAAEDNNGKRYELRNENIASMNLFTFHPSISTGLRNYFSQFIIKYRNDINAECQLPSAVESIIGNNRARVKVIMTDESWFGVTYKNDKKLVGDKLKYLVERGVYPSKLWNGNV